MSRFRSLFSRGATQLLVDNFGESITYYPNGDTSGGGRLISAMIERNVESLSQGGDVMGFVTVVRVLDDSTTGISSTEIDSGQDLIGVAMRVGESQRLKQITRILSTENGIVRFEVN